VGWGIEQVGPLTVLSRPTGYGTRFAAADDGAGLVHLTARRSPLCSGLLRRSKSPAAGGNGSFLALLSLTPASCDLLRLRDDPRFAHVIVLVPFPSVPASVEGTEGNFNVGEAIWDEERS
jgi:hypothetical protein